MTILLKKYEKNALIYEEKKLSFGSLLGNIEFFSTLVPEEGGDKVVIFSENRLEWIYTIYASWKMDKIVVPIDFLSVSDEVSYIINDCKAEIIFCSNQTKEVLDSALENVNHDVEIIVFDTVKVPDKNNEIAFPEMVKDDTAFIIYTSGTTGHPKGVMLSFDNIYANIEGVCDSVPFYTNDSGVLALLPFHHILPIMGTVVAPLSVGATVVLSKSVSSEDIMNALGKNRVTMIVAVPRFYSMIRKGIMTKIEENAVAKLLFLVASKIESMFLSKKLFKKVHQKLGGNIEHLICGGAVLDPEIERDFKTLGLTLYNGYGMTEAAPMISFPRIDNVKMGAAGKPLIEKSVKIVDGEILVKGRNVMQGYYNKREETENTIVDGWLHTGDLGYLDEEENLFITGRKKELIVLPNGKNIDPIEIETKLENSTELIAEVGVFMKDDILQTLIYPNFLRIKEIGMANMDEYFRWEIIDRYNKSATPYKKIMKFTLVRNELPKTRLGKLKRFELENFIENIEKSRENIEEPEFEEYVIIKNYISVQMGKNAGPEDHLEIDLGLDSLDKVTLQVFLKNSFGIEVTESDLTENATVELLSNFVSEKKTKVEKEDIDWKKILKEDAELELPQSSLYHIFLKYFFKFFLKFFLRIKMDGIEKLPASPFILAANHQSVIDGLLVDVFLKNKTFKNTYFFAKEKHLKQWWRRYLARKNNMITMDVNRDLQGSIRKMASVLKQGGNIIIFPEGTRSRDGKLNRFKKTFAILSVELNVPVVPVAIKGALKALPKDSAFLRAGTEVCVKFLPAVSPEGYSSDKLASHVVERIEKNIE